MSVGNQLTKATLDNQLTDLAVQARNVNDLIRVRFTPVSVMGVTGLGTLGYGTTANAANPGGVSDAQYAWNLWGYLSTGSGVYYGQVQQGGTGGTGASTFNFDNALSAVWAGQ